MHRRRAHGGEIHLEFPVAPAIDLRGFVAARLLIFDFQASSSTKRETLLLAFAGGPQCWESHDALADPSIRELLFFDGARDLDPLASNLDWSPDGDSTVPQASDGSYCSSIMQALVASEAGGAGVSWMRPRQCWCI